MENKNVKMVKNKLKKEWIKKNPWLFLVLFVFLTIWFFIFKNFRDPLYFIISIIAYIIVRLIIYNKMMIYVESKIDSNTYI